MTTDPKQNDDMPDDKTPDDAAQDHATHEDDASTPEVGQGSDLTPIPGDDAPAEDNATIIDPDDITDYFYVPVPGSDYDPDSDGAGIIIIDPDDTHDDDVPLPSKEGKPAVFEPSTPVNPAVDAEDPVAAAPEPVAEPEPAPPQNSIEQRIYEEEHKKADARAAKRIKSLSSPATDLVKGALASKWKLVAGVFAGGALFGSVMTASCSSDGEKRQRTVERQPEEQLGSGRVPVSNGNGSDFYSAAYTQGGKIVIPPALLALASEADVAHMLKVMKAQAKPDGALHVLQKVAGVNSGEILIVPIGLLNDDAATLQVAKALKTVQARQFVPGMPDIAFRFERDESGNVTVTRDIGADKIDSDQSGPDMQASVAAPAP